jgi:hypothetical protein
MVNTSSYWNRPHCKDGARYVAIYICATEHPVAISMLLVQPTALVLTELARVHAVVLQSLEANHDT